MRIKSAFLILITFVVLAGNVLGVSVQIHPIRQQIQANQKTTSLEVVNNGEQSITFQVSAKRWRNILGKDQVDHTTDLLVTPPIFSIAPGEKQIVRVGVITLPDPSVGAAYRVFLKEVPAAPSKNSKNPTSSISLVTLLELSVPIVISPSIPSKPYASWEIKRVSDKKIRLTIHNKGKSFISLHQVSLKKENETRAFLRQPIENFILPNERKAFELELPYALKAGNIELEAKADQGEMKAIVPIQVP